MEQRESNNIAKKSVNLSSKYGKQEDLAKCFIQSRDMDDDDRMHGLKNIDDYEKQKLERIIHSFENLKNTMDFIGTWTPVADEQGIYVDKDFTFSEIYKTCGFESNSGNVNFNDLMKKIDGYKYNLQKSFESKSKNVGENSQKSSEKNMDDYEMEYFKKIKKQLSDLVDAMHNIRFFASEADKYGIYVKKDFTFDKIYRTGGFGSDEHGQLNFDDLMNQIMKYNCDLQDTVTFRKNKKK